jgi:hypothetical protein
MERRDLWLLVSELTMGHGGSKKDD